MNPLLFLASVALSRKKLYKCTHEGCKFVTHHAPAFVMHEKTHYDGCLKCVSCNRRIKRSEIGSHMRKHLKGFTINALSKTFKCRHKNCKFTTLHAPALLAHEKRHESKRFIKCTKCDKLLDRFSMPAHMRSHASEIKRPKIFKCDNAGCNFAHHRVQSLSIHKKYCRPKVEKEAIYVCNEPGCNFTSSNHIKYVNHFNSHIAMESDDENTVFYSSSRSNMTAIAE